MNRNLYQTTFVLSRVLNSGVIMSIERSERELASLEKILRELSSFSYCSLFNSFTGAIHGALWGQNIVEKDAVYLANPSDQERKFIKWLDIQMGHSDGSSKQSYSVVNVHSETLAEIKPLLLNASQMGNVVVLDFTALGFGPCAALLCDHEEVWKRAERLKIFGAFDLRTMWTQLESEKSIRPMAQFNYRLSPLVASCVKMSLLGSSL